MVSTLVSVIVLLALSVTFRVSMTEVAVVIAGTTMVGMIVSLLIIVIVLSGFCVHEIVRVASSSSESVAVASVRVTVDPLVIFRAGPATATGGLSVTVSESNTVTIKES